MKATFKNMLLGYLGAHDGLVYYVNPRLGRVIVRPHVIPRVTENNRRFARVHRNLKALNPSPGLRADLRVYTDIHNRKVDNQFRHLPNWYNAYVRMMHALARAWLIPDPDVPGGDPVPIDLATLTRAQITDHDLPCRSVKRAIEAGLLEPVRGYEILTQEF